MHRFYKPLNWKLPTFIGVALVWTFLYGEVGLLWASIVALLLLAVVAVVWYTVRRRWWS